MAENSFAALNPNAGIDRANINRVGPGWDQLNQRVERPDYALNLPLRDPRFDQPEKPPVLPVAQPTEAELRQLLAEALKTKSECEAALHRAEAAHQRAEEHLSRCRLSLAAYASLDSAIADAAIEALRCSTGLVPTAMSEEHELALSDRERARVELVAAESAVNTFRAEHAQASQALGDATKATDVLIGTDRPLALARVAF